MGRGIKPREATYKEVNFPVLFVGFVVVVVFHFYSDRFVLKQDPVTEFHSSATEQQYSTGSSSRSK